MERFWLDFGSKLEGKTEPKSNKMGSKWWSKKECKTSRHRELMKISIRGADSVRHHHFRTMGRDKGRGKPLPRMGIRGPEVSYKRLSPLTSGLADYF